MKLEPVYLVAPRPRITTRRAFVFAAGSALGGLAVGFAGGWLSRGWLADGAPPIDPNLAERIAWAQSIAAQPEDQVLMDNLAGFLAVTREAVSAKADTEALWAAALRSGRLLVDNAELPTRRLLAKSLINTLRLCPQSLLDAQLLTEIESIAR